MLNITNSAEPTSLGLKQMLGQYPHQDLTYVKCEPPEATPCSVIWQILIFYSFCYSSHTTNITWFTAKLRLWDVLSLLQKSLIKWAFTSGFPETSAGTHRVTFCAVTT